MLREWLSAVDMVVDGGVAISSRLCVMARFVKKYDRIRVQGVSACTFSSGLYGKLWEPVTKIAFKK